MANEIGKKHKYNRRKKEPALEKKQRPQRAMLAISLLYWPIFLPQDFYHMIVFEGYRRHSLFCA